MLDIPKTSEPDAPDAAVLIPLCNIDSRPSIIYEVRGKLRTHSGEVRCVEFICRSLFILCRMGVINLFIVHSFPGGRVDNVCQL